MKFFNQLYEILILLFFRKTKIGLYARNAQPKSAYTSLDFQYFRILKKGFSKNTKSTHLSLRSIYSRGQYTEEEIT
ncbi:hypothetical protein GCM10022216_35680 [Sphingobacterium kyonggiense]|uniref:Uncharacterized protein n=1 Tax=Sphingobacterium kyonggiense TaxID=714075 RepID=A0ABP7Z6U5_9SPHI